MVQFRCNSSTPLIDIHLDQWEIQFRYSLFSDFVFIWIWIGNVVIFRRSKENQKVLQYEMEYGFAQTYSTFRTFASLSSLLIS